MDPRPNQLEFTDCLSCGKRVATTAKICHHCKKPRLQTVSIGQTIPRSKDSNENESDDELDSHAALSYGGYDAHDIDENEVETPSKIHKLWWYVAWILLAISVLGAMVPFL
jgi:hypothetical protein